MTVAAIASLGLSIAIVPAAWANPDIWQRLRTPDQPYFVLMRHALAPGTGDPAAFDLSDCSTQRNLAAEGRAQAERTGAAFRAEGVMVAQVFSSAWCRCLDTATLLDLGPVEVLAPLNSFFRDRNQAEAQTTALTAFMQAQAAQPGVTVLVTHFVNIAAVADVSVTSGGMAVLRLADNQTLAWVGLIEAL